MEKPGQAEEPSVASNRVGWAGQVRRDVPGRMDK